MYNCMESLRSSVVSVNIKQNLFNDNKNHNMFVMQEISMRKRDWLKNAYNKETN